MLTYDNSIQFGKGKEPTVVLRNFYPPEDGFVWSSSRWSDVTFGFSAGAGRRDKIADVVLDLDVFKVEGQTGGQNALIYLNGLRVGSHYITRRTTVVIPIDSAVLKPTENVLTFDTPDSRMPSDYGIADKRLLGIQLFSLKIRPAD
jgi:hypothetical protein